VPVPIVPSCWELPTSSPVAATAPSDDAMGNAAVFGILRDA
jgi:hypothetical protein